MLILLLIVTLFSLFIIAFFLHKKEKLSWGKVILLYVIVPVGVLFHIFIFIVICFESDVFFKKYAFTAQMRIEKILEIQLPPYRVIEREFERSERLIPENNDLVRIKIEFRDTQEKRVFYQYLKNKGMNSNGCYYTSNFDDNDVLLLIDVDSVTNTAIVGCGPF